MKAVRENSVVIRPVEKIKEESIGIITDFNQFNEGEVISSNFEGIEEGDVIIYDDGLTVGQFKVVFEDNIIIKK